MNFVEEIITRVDDFLFPNDAFLIEIFVNLQDEAGVTGMSVMAGSTQVTLTSDGGPEWDDELPFTSFASMTAGLNGTWTITVQGSSPSTSAFTLNANALMDSNFFQTPTNVMPANGSTGVATDATLSWTAPPLGTTADVLVVFVGTENEMGLEQEATSLEGLLITDTMWTTPLPMEAGMNEFDVIYLNVDASFVTNLSSATVVWGDSEVAPPGYPPATPLLLLGSDTIVGFTVPEPAAVLSLLAAMGTLFALTTRRRRAFRLASR